LRSVISTHNKRIAYGLLSLDRTVHTVDDAAEFIQRVLDRASNALVGIDISGFGELKNV
jgi:adenosine deaminase